MKSLPPEFALLKKIGKYLDEYFLDALHPRTARSTDIYEFLRHKEDIRNRFPTGRDFGSFMKKMHLHYESVVRQFIAYKVIDTNPDFLQWYYFPKDQIMIREITDTDKIKAQTVIDPYRLKTGRKDIQAANGDYVRSVAELHIYNTLLAEECFTIYYERAQIAAGKELFPDFTIHNRKTDTVFFWEHFGLAQNERYMQKMAEKIEWYRRIGISRIEDGGRFIATIFINENHFVKLVDEMILKMKEVIVSDGFIRNGL